MKREPLFQNDTLKVTVTVRDRLPDGTTGSVVNLTGAVLTCAIGAPDALGVAGTVTPVDLANGVVTVMFPAVGNSVGSYCVAQLRVTRAGETQTCWQQVYSIAPSIVAP